MENQLISFKYKPLKLSDIIGQEHLIKNNGIIKKMVDSKKIFSIIFYGIPGIGKSSIARVICNELNIDYFEFNPTVNSKKDLESFLNNIDYSKNNVLIIDEYHRMNKDKQDILLSFLEKGNLILFATTTENPFFCINPAIRSRCHILKLNPISFEEQFNGLKNISIKNNMNVDDQLLKDIVKNSGGDLRKSINTLELIFSLYGSDEIQSVKINDIFGDSYSFVAKYGDELHNLKSALHKSIRGSDPDATIYYLSRLIKSEDLIAINRRLIACAYEDIGLANPTLLPRVFLATQAAEKVGFPEANQILSTIAIEMALSPKSNSAYKAISQAIEDNNNGHLYKIPEHLNDNHYKSASKFNKGIYLYPHNYKNSWVEQQYLPKELKNKKYYNHLKYNSIENKLIDQWNKMKGK